jgi:hypothetical protein
MAAARSGEFEIMGDGSVRLAGVTLAPDEGAERRQLGAIGGREVRLDRFNGLDDVGVGVEDAIAAACHDRSS